MNVQGLLVGLGNPGPQYRATRHNTGFLWVDRLLALAGRKGRVESLGGGKFSCELWRVTLESLGGSWLVAKPMTFMNLSGQCVQPLLAWHRIDPAGLVVVHDELDLPPGALRFKIGGGNAGHNGLKSITQLLGTPDFCRLRIGIGRPPRQEGDVTGWVLGHPSMEDRELWEKAMDAGLEVMEAFAARGLESAVRTANARSKKILKEAAEKAACEKPAPGQSAPAREEVRQAR